MSIQLIGLDKIIGNVKKVTDKMAKDGQDAVVEWAYNVEGRAKTLAPADEGHLRNNITAKIDRTKDFIKAEVVVMVDYAAYMEFGTKRYAAKYVATLPKQWREYAATFKGKGDGNLDQFIQRIMAWVQRKGIGADVTKGGNFSASKSSLDNQQQAAYQIALNILQNGVKPSPFLYPAVRDNRAKLFKKLKQIYR